MKVKTFCDRCEKELYQGSGSLRVKDTIRVEESNGTPIWYLCEACSVELRHWIARDQVPSL